MTLPRRFRCLVPFLAIALVAIALGACSPVKKGPAGPCTQFWRGYVLASDHNYAGLGAFTGSDRYMCKDTPTQGVRAQLQHLRNYADAGSTADNLGNPFEPRVKYDATAFNTFFLKGQAPRWVDLTGKWATASGYGELIMQIYNEMRVFNQLSTLPQSTSIMDAVGTNQLTAKQIANYIKAKNKSAGNVWRPEITEEEMAQLFLNEGRAAKVRGDIAFCQSILETGWFSWPGSYAGAEVSAADAATTGYFDLQDVTARN